jgi:hypothetical protein
MSYADYVKHLIAEVSKKLGIPAAIVAVVQTKPHSPAIAGANHFAAAHAGAYTTVQACLKAKGDEFDAALHRTAEEWIIAQRLPADIPEPNRRNLAKLLWIAGKAFEVNVKAKARANRMRIKTEECWTL